MQPTPTKLATLNLTKPNLRSLALGVLIILLTAAALIFIALSMVVDAIQAKAKDELVFLRWPLAARSAALAVAVLLIAMSLTQGEVQVFFYQRF